jgi:carbamate kinase
MRVVVALGGNAILKRGEPMTAEHQRLNVRHAAKSIAEVIEAGHQVVITHGNGPQIGLMALQDMAHDQALASPTDVLGAETEGMLGYLIAQELGNVLPKLTEIAALLTQIEVDAADPAFQNPTKPIGPVYLKQEAADLAAKHNWIMVPDGVHFRRAVASPRPKRILEIGVIRLLVENDVTVICAGGGGIPVIQKNDGRHIGVEAVIDKDHASGLLARELDAEVLLLLTDVDGVYLDWGTPQQRRLVSVAPVELSSHTFASGSMAPKVAAAIDFATSGHVITGIGRLEDALEILEQRAGTVVKM